MLCRLRDRFPPCTTLHVLRHLSQPVPKRQLCRCRWLFPVGLILMCRVQGYTVEKWKRSRLPYTRSMQMNRQTQHGGSTVIVFLLWACMFIYLSDHWGYESPRDQTQEVVQQHRVVGHGQHCWTSINNVTIT